MNDTALKQLSGSPGCVMCDNNGSNPRSLALKIFWDEDSGTVRIPCEPDDTWCGYNQVVHGGIVASLLDEAMAWVVKQKSGDWAFTAEYTIRYKRAVTPKTRYWAVAEVEELNRRKITAQARLLDPDGHVVAQASAVFLPVNGRAAPRGSGQSE